MTRTGRHTVTPEDLDFWRGLIRLADRAARGAATRSAAGLVREAKRSGRVPAPGAVAGDNPFFVLGGIARRYAGADVPGRSCLQGELAAAARKAAAVLEAHEAGMRPRERKDIDG